MKNIIFLPTSLIACLLFLFSCNTEKDSDTINSKTIIIYDNGSTSTGAIFEYVDPNRIYIDDILYYIHDDINIASICGIKYYDSGENYSEQNTELKDIAPYGTIIYKNRTYLATYVANHAFWCSDINSIVIPNTVTRIKGSAFASCENMTYIKLSDNTEYIGSKAFHYCTNLKSIDLPSKLDTIQERAFRNCSALESVNFPENLHEIGYLAFYNCINLKKITLPKSLTKINDCVFYGCSSLASVKIPDGVELIGEETFKECSKLRNIELPSSLKTIKSNAFTSCGLYRIYCYALEPPMVERNSFGINTDSGLAREVELHVPKGTKEAYKNSYWPKFNIIDDL